MDKYNCLREMKVVYIYTLWDVNRFMGLVSSAKDIGWNEECKQK